MANSPRPSILFLSSHHGSGAAESLWLETAELLARKGVNVRAAAAWVRPNEQRLEGLRAAGVRVEWLARSGLAWRLLRKLLSPNSILRRQVRGLAGPPGSTALVLVSQGNDHSALPWLEAFQAVGVPTAVVTHGIIPGDWPNDKVAARLRAAFIAARATYWVSKRNQTDFEFQIGSYLPQGEVVWNPVKSSASAEVTWPAETSPWRMACVARLQVRPKGHDLLLQTLALPHWRQRDLQLSIFGSGENQQGLRDLVAMLGITNKVTFPGHVESVEEIWKQHHLMAQPSRNEGMPLSLVEALMCGRPVLATDVAGHAELVEDGVNGFIADSPCVKHLDQALERAWQQRTCWQAMGAEAATRIRQQVPAEPVADFAARLLALAGQSMP